jgi:hypothetical protein
MTARQYRRLRRWELRTAKAYNAGSIEGMDSYYLGEPRPVDPDEGYDAPFDLRFCVWPGDRLEQFYRNNRLAHERGALDGWDQAKERAGDEEREAEIDSLATDFVGDVETWLRMRAA